MPYEILRTPQVKAALRRMSAREKRSYEAAVDGLRGGLATVGRRRSDKPPCCDDPSKLPAMNEELRELLSALA
jgi:hypothetical protein